MMPPSYESSCGNLNAALNIGCNVIMGLVLAVPISMIVMGSIYLDDCPAQRHIPIYLIVSGVFDLLKTCICLIQRCKNQADGNDEGNVKTNPCEGIIGCFLLAWLITGSVWIYGTYNDFSDDKNDPDYCNETLYWYAFWITAAMYISAVISCCIRICRYISCSDM